MHNDPIEENSKIQKNWVFDRNNTGVFINNLIKKLSPLSKKANIKYRYHNFTIARVFSYIKKFLSEFQVKRRKEEPTHRMIMNVRMCVDKLRKLFMIPYKTQR